MKFKKYLSSKILTGVLFIFILLASFPFVFLEHLNNVYAAGESTSETWTIDPEQPVPQFEDSDVIEVNFSSNGTNYVAMGVFEIGAEEENGLYYYSVYDADDEGNCQRVKVCSSQDGSYINWTNNAYKTVTFSSTVDSSSNLGQWLSTNAQKANSFNATCDNGSWSVKYLKDGIETDFSSGNKVIGISSINVTIKEGSTVSITGSGYSTGFSDSAVNATSTVTKSWNLSTDICYKIEYSSNAINIIGCYPIVFNKNTTDTVTGDLTGSYCVAGDQINLSSKTLTRAGYKFLGWNTSSGATTALTLNDGKYTIQASDIVNSKVTFYAVWQAKTTVSITETAQTYTYGSSDIKFAISGTPNSDFSVKYLVGGEWKNEAPTNAGSYNVKIARDEDETYKSYPEKIITNGLVISKATPVITLVANDAENLRYDKSVKTLLKTASTTGGTLEMGFSFVSTEEPANYATTLPVATEAKTYYIWCKVVGNDNYNDIPATYKFSVNIIQTYTITYNGNDNTGGTVPTDSNRYAENENISVLGNTGELVRNNYKFVGWNTKQDGSDVTTYIANNNYTVGTSDVVLYAKWQKIISAEPNSDNDYTVSVCDGLTVASYQWYESSTTNLTGDFFQESTENPYLSIWGGVDKGTNKVGTFSFKGPTRIEIKTINSTKKSIIRFTCNNINNFISGATLKGNYYEVEFNGVETKMFLFSAETTITITEFIVNSAEEVKNETSAKFGLEKPKNVSYYCALTLTTGETAISTEISPLEINFDGNDSTSGSDPNTIYQLEGRKITLPENSFTKTGYIYLGWNSDKDATSALTPTEGKYTIQSSDIFDSKVTLYAVWQPRTHICNNILFDIPLTNNFNLGYFSSGNYYLYEDIYFDSLTEIIINFESVVNLCLNGHKFEFESNDSQIVNRGTLNIYDCDIAARYYGDTNNDGVFEISNSNSEKAIKFVGGYFTSVHIFNDSTAKLNAYGINFIKTNFNGNGGAIYSNGDLNLFNCVFLGNSSSKNGGAVYNMSKALMQNCEFRYNSAVDGGAICNGKNAVTTLIGCKIENNSASGKGAGVLVSSEEEGNCLIAGTLITLADGTTKNIEEIAVNDEVKVFNHETGELSSAKICYVYESEKDEYYFTLNFTNDLHLSIVGAHDLFEQSSLKYVTITRENATSFVNKYFYNAISNRFEKLESVTFSNQKSSYYAIYTSKHLNCIANDMLTVADDVDYTVNCFGFDNDLKINQTTKNADIEQYGLFAYDDAKAYMDEDHFDNFNVEYFKIWLGRGLVTKSEAIQLCLESNNINSRYYDKANGTTMLILGSNTVIKNNKVGDNVSNVYLDGSSAEIAFIDGSTGIDIAISMSEAGTFASHSLTFDELNNITRNSGFTLTSDDSSLGIKETSSTVESTTTYLYSLENVYSVIYNADDKTSGTVPVDSKTYFAGEDVSILGNTGNLTRAGYKFIGWASTENGEVITSSTIPMVENGLTLYAVWQSLEYDKDFDFTISGVEYGATKSTMSVLINSVDGVNGSDGIISFESLELFQEGDTPSDLTLVQSITTPGVYRILVGFTLSDSRYFKTISFMMEEMYIGDISSTNGTIYGRMVCSAYNLSSKTYTTNVDGYLKFKIVTDVRVTLTGNNVTYNDNVEDETITMPEDANTYLKNAPITISSATPTRAGYKFIGWNTNKKATTKLNNCTMGENGVMLYAIWQEKATVSINETAQTKTYNGSSQGFVISGNITNGFDVKYYCNGTWQTTAPTNVGSYNIKISRAEDNTYKSYSKEIVNGLVIGKAQAVISVDETAVTKTYGESVTIPTATSNFGTVVCDKLASDFTNAGSYVITYTVAGTNNYYGATKTVSVTINKLAVNEPIVVGNYKYTGEAQTVYLSGKESYMTTTDSLTQTNVGKYTITFTLDDNHEWANGSDGIITWEIKALSIVPQNEQQEKKNVVVETENGFSSDITVTVEVTVETEIEQKELTVNYYNLSGNKKLADNEKVGVVFDVKLKKNGEVVSLSNLEGVTSIKVKMLIPETVDKSKVTKILHVHSSTDIEEIAFDVSRVNEDGYYEIEVDKLSEFAFIYKTENQTNVSIYCILGGIGLLIIALLIIFLKKRKLTVINNEIIIKEFKFRPLQNIAIKDDFVGYELFDDRALTKPFTRPKMGFKSIVIYIKDSKNTSKKNIANRLSSITVKSTNSTNLTEKQTNLKSKEKSGVANLSIKNRNIKTKTADSIKSHKDSKTK